MPSHPPSIPEQPHYMGHRKRLKDKCIKHPESLKDYELLELFLCLIVPRMDVKPLAKTLLKECGSLSHVMQADAVRLKSIKGVGESIVMGLRLLQAWHTHVLQESSATKTSMNARDIVQHCQNRIGFHSIEHVLVLFLDNQQRFMSDHIIHTGTVDQTTLYPREILKRALDVGASSIVISHNHPGGDSTPSREDVIMTHHVHKAAQALNIALLDHIIVSDRDYTSLRHMGLLEEASTS